MSRPASWPRLPAHGDGQRIGLLGGSFNPAHGGHRQISLLALHRLSLDAVWWLVTPGNPLKNKNDLADLEDRMDRARSVATHPRIKVTGFEAEAGTSFTADTLRLITKRCRSLRLVWLMGADNLAGFHRWDRWQWIADHVPIAVVDRPQATFGALASPAAHALARARVKGPDQRMIADLCPPAWAFVFGPRSSESSTRLRNRQ